MNRLNLLEFGKEYLAKAAQEFATQQGAADPETWDKLITNPAFLTLRENIKKADQIIADEKMKVLNPRIQDGLEVVAHNELKLMSLGGLSRRIGEGLSYLDAALLEVESRTKDNPTMEAIEKNLRKMSGMMRNLSIQLIKAGKPK